MPGCAKCGKEQDILTIYATTLNGTTGSFALCDECLVEVIKEEREA